MSSENLELVEKEYSKSVQKYIAFDLNNKMSSDRWGEDQIRKHVQSELEGFESERVELIVQDIRNAIFGVPIVEVKEAEDITMPTREGTDEIVYGKPSIVSNHSLEEAEV